ncbi:MAG: quinone oxidoreductase [Ignavibacteria bacterium]|nr:quinone oxidoreductase [Ignavibacteria bacterium]
MQNQTFKAFVVEETAVGKFERKFIQKPLDSLPAGDVLIRVHYSTLNYKDGLSARGHKGITRKYPHTPGVDAAGIVEQSDSPDFKPGDEVIVTGFDLGMNTSGGFAEYIRVPAGWVVPLPKNMTLRSSMIYGTAGFTAGIAINELQKRNIMPDSGKILVTGSTGGVGSLAVAMLSKAGYYVVASSGKPEKSDFIKRLGAKEIISREEVRDSSQKALLSARWVGAIDNVGGDTLSTIVKSLAPWGAVCSIGLVGSDKLETTVYPFILRGVSIIGVDSAERKMSERLMIWKRISNEWLLDDIEFIVKEVSLDAISDEIDIILLGGQVGKVVVRIE